MLNVKEYSGGKLAVLISGNEEQRHVGFYIKEGAEPELIHLGSHLRLHNNTESDFLRFAGRFSAFECEHFLDEQVEEIVSFIKTVWRKNQNRVPYGIGSDNFAAFFDGEGTVANRNPGTGLTCATFLMSVFASQRYPVIAEDSWQKRDEDKIWQEMVLTSMLAHDPDLADHVAEQRKFVDVAYRYRPEEVAACSAMYDDEPFQFAEAVIIGQELLQKIRVQGILAGN